jgi:transcriptional regulator with XRE-family HTH domain
MILLRRVLGDALRARRQAQHRTLREVSGAANVSLGYLSEVERGQKEASSELLAAICDALGTQLSDVLRDASDTMELAELTRSGGVLTGADQAVGYTAPAPRETSPVGGTVTNFVGDGGIAVAVHRDGPLRTTLRATRPLRDVVRAA